VGNGDGVGGVPVHTVNLLSTPVPTPILVTDGSLNVGTVESPVIIATVPVGEINKALAFCEFAVAAVQVPLQK
jgi:hypothetical protein